jgi:hypothetical protein
MADFEKSYENANRPFLLLSVFYSGFAILDRSPAAQNQSVAGTTNSVIALQPEARLKSTNLLNASREVAFGALLLS